MRGLTYAKLAADYGIDLCGGECGDSGHEDGWYGGRMIHFRERGVTRSGLRLFLMLVHDATDWRQPLPTHRKLTNRLRWIHSRNTFAYFHALQLGIRLPRELSARDRATVRYLITKVPKIDEVWLIPAVRSWSARG